MKSEVFSNHNIKKNKFVVWMQNNCTPLKINTIVLD